MKHHETKNNIYALVEHLLKAPPQKPAISQAIACDTTKSRQSSGLTTFVKQEKGKGRGNVNIPISPAETLVKYYSIQM